MKLRWSAATAAAFAMLASGLIATPAYAATDSEPNGSFATASPLPVNTTVTGTTRLTGSVDDDFYAVDIPDDGAIKLGLTFPSNLGTGKAYNVTVYGTDHSALYTFNVNCADSDGAKLAAKGVFLPKGRAFVEISGSSSLNTWGVNYDLNVGFASGNVELEPNGGTGNATPLGVGTTISGSTLRNATVDNDYYTVDLASAGTVQLNLQFPSNLGSGAAYDVGVYSTNGTPLYSFSVNCSQSDGAALAAKAIYLPAGRAYISISGVPASETWGAIYTLSVGWNAGTVELEPNGDTDHATPLSLGTTIAGSSLRNAAADADFYKLSVPTAGPLHITLKFPSTLGSGDAYTVSVYNAAGTKQEDFPLWCNDWNGTRLAERQFSLPAGTSYIAIRGINANATWGQPYTLNVGYRWTTTSTPTISGSATIGSTLTADPGTWTPTPDAITYQWYRSGTAIQDATAKIYTVTSGDAGANLSVAVTASKAGYPATTITSASTAAVPAPPTPVLSTSKPYITGKVKVKKRLKAHAGSWGPAPVTLKYRWYRNGKKISGATDRTYKIAKKDRKKKLAVRVCGSKSGYETRCVKSSYTKKVKK